jgi:glycine/D-amino acid oxidase-like deaminating enzyme
VGDGGEIGGAFMAMSQGFLAGYHAAVSLGWQPNAATRIRSWFERSRFQKQRLFQKHLWAGFQKLGLHLPMGSGALACRCEAVFASDLSRARDDEVETGRQLKQTTRAGMGYCQGRNCRSQLQALVADSGNSVLDEPNVRIPFRPMRIGSIASKLPDPQETNLIEGRPFQVKLPSRDLVLADVDVIVVGAGIVGQTTSYLLAREGMSVCLLDQRNYNSSASGLNAGSLHVQMTGYFADELFNSSSEKDRTGISDILPLGVKAVKVWKLLEQELGTNIDLKFNGGIIVAESDADEAKLRKKVEFEQSHGVPVEYVSRDILLERAPWLSETIRGGSLCPLEGKVNPLLAGRALIEACKRLGVKLVRYAPISEIHRDSAGFVVSTSPGRIRAKRLVNACGADANAVAALLGTFIPVKGKSIQLAVTERVPLKVDMLVGHASTRLTMKQTHVGNILIGGGWPANEDHGTGSLDIRYDSLRGNLGAALRVLPMLSDYKLLRAWTGIAPVTGNGAPIIGALQGVNDAYVCVTEVGYTLGPLCAQMLVDMITGRQPVAMTGTVLSLGNQRTAAVQSNFRDIS